MNEQQYKHFRKELTCHLKYDVAQKPVVSDCCNTLFCQTELNKLGDIKNCPNKDCNDHNPTFKKSPLASKLIHLLYDVQEDLGEDFGFAPVPHPDPEDEAENQMMGDQQQEEEKEEEVPEEAEQVEVAPVLEVGPDQMEVLKDGESVVIEKADFKQWLSDNHSDEVLMSMYSAHFLKNKPSGDSGAVQFEVLVRNIPYDVSESQIFKIFEACGSLARVKLLRGKAFLKFGSEEGKTRAMQLNGVNCNGRELRVGEPFAVNTDTQPENEVYVRNIPFDVNEEQLKEKFAEFGEVTEVRLDRGRANIKFVEEEGVQKALAFDSQEFEGRQLRIDVARSSRAYAYQGQQERRDGGMGGYGQDRFQGGDRREGGYQQRDRRESFNVENQVFIGNLPFEVNEYDVKDYFDNCGQVVKVKLIAGGKGFVYFSDSDGKNKALELNQTEFNQRKIFVEAAKGQRSNVQRSNPEQTVFVGGLNYDTTKEELQECFADCGEIQDVSLPSQPGQDRNKGFAHIAFVDKDSVQKALEKNGMELAGRQVRVDQARQRENRGRGGDRGGRGGRGGYGDRNGYQRDNNRGGYSNNEYDKQEGDEEQDGHNQVYNDEDYNK